jgi:hypothetical protein
MTTEEMDHAIEFLLEHHARGSVEIQQLREAQKEQAENLAKLSETVRDGFAETREGFAELGELLDAATAEMRAGFAETRQALVNLILANEVTRILPERPPSLPFRPARE